MMSRVYPTARVVLCWLGPADDKSVDVMHNLEKLSRSRDLLSDASSNPNPKYDLSPAEETKFLDGLYELTNRPWFTRVWTCQEFALTPHDPQLLCGHQAIPWSSFRQIMNIHQYKVSWVPKNSNGPPLKSHQKVIEKEVQMDALQLRQPQGPFIPLQSVFALEHGRENALLEIVAITRSHKATNPLDKIYGVLGFLSGPYRTLFPPNYSHSVDSVLRDIPQPSCLLAKWVMPTKSSDQETVH